MKKSLWVPNSFYCDVITESVIQFRVRGGTLKMNCTTQNRVQIKYSGVLHLLYSAESRSKSI